jgi:hypothetical protein
MRQPIVRRFAIVGTLAMILFVAQPGSAQAGELRTAGTWGWLQQLWTQGIAALWTGPGAPEPARGDRSAGAPSAEDLRKDGGHIGWPQTPPPPVPPGSLSATSDNGNGMDPNG